jgi:hypothetical protein
MCVVGVRSIVSCTVEILKYHKTPRSIASTGRWWTQSSRCILTLCYTPATWWPTATPPASGRPFSRGNERWYTFDYGNARFVCLQVDGSARYERKVNGITYVVTAGGGAPLYAMQEQEPTQAAFALAHHFVLLEIDGRHLRATAISSGGEVLDQFERSAD